MKLSNEWFSALSTAENGNLIIVSGREELDEFKACRKLKERVEIYWKYEGDDKGMPTDSEAELMENVQEKLQKAVEKDKLAILTGIYTGDKERTLVFYTRTSRVFGERLNEALAEFELLPISLYVELDEEWDEYTDMYEMKEFEIE
ncbi:MAG: DUF695 domain-containing protein [Bacteroidales bacterium]